MLSHICNACPAATPGEDSECLAKEWESRGVIAHILVHDREVVQAAGVGWVALAQPGAAGIQDLTEERDGRGMVAQFSVQHRQILQAEVVVRVVLARAGCGKSRVPA